MRRRCARGRRSPHVARGLSRRVGRRREGRDVRHHRRGRAPVVTRRLRRCSRLRPHSAGSARWPPTSASRCISRRAVSQIPSRAADLLRRWLPVRAATGLAALDLSLAGVRAARRLDRGRAADALLFTLAYAASGLSECLYYFFRGLDRTDLESTLHARAARRRWACSPRRAVVAAGRDAARPAHAAARDRRRCRWQRLRRGGSPLASRHRWRRHGAANPARVPDGVAPIGVGILLSALYFRDRRVPARAMERHDGRRALQRRVSPRRGAAALSRRSAGRGAARRSAGPRDLPPARPSCGAADRGRLWRGARPLAHGRLDRARDLRRTRTPTPSRRSGSLLFALPLMALNYALTHQLIGWHGQRAYAGICAGALAFNVLLNWQLIPALGMTGAAWSTVWTEVVPDRGLRRRADAAGAAGAGTSPQRRRRHHWRRADVTPMPLVRATAEAGLTPAEESIARSVLYAALFDYPLTLAQLRQTLIGSRQTASEIIATYVASAAPGARSSSSATATSFPPDAPTLSHTRRHRETTKPRVPARRIDRCFGSLRRCRMCGWWRCRAASLT